MLEDLISSVALPALSGKSNSKSTAPITQAIAPIAAKVRDELRFTPLRYGIKALEVAQIALSGKAVLNRFQAKLSLG